MLGLLGAAAVIWTFHASVDFDFTNLDDDQVIVHNPHFRGFGRESLEWMFTTRWMGQYQPLTWLTYAADQQFLEHTPRAYHAMNVVWHALTTVVLFVLSRRLLLLAIPTRVESVREFATTATWTSALLATLYAVHPLRVESVCWITGRNDLVASCLGLLAVLAWLRYAAVDDRTLPRAADLARASIPAWLGAGLVAASITTRDDRLVLGSLGSTGLILGGLLCIASAVMVLLALARSRGRRSATWYAVAWSACALSLAAKPWFLAMPILLLVLDAWPLARFDERQRDPSAPSTARPHRFWSLTAEKLPFAILSAVVGVLGLWAKRGGATLLAEEQLPDWIERIAEACYAVVFYLWKTIVPTDLKPIYDRPAHLTWTDWPFVSAVAFVIVSLALLIVVRKRVPALCAAAACYLLLLTPSLGIVPYGFQLVADRYSYAAMMPVYVLAAGAVCVSWIRLQGPGRVVLGLLAVSVMAISVHSTRRQAGVWRDSETLWNHTLSLGEAPRALANLALVHESRASADPQAAAASVASAIQLSGRAIDLATQQGTFVPEYLLIHGTILLNAGEVERAIELLRRFVDLRPENARGLVNLGLALNRGSEFDAASHVLLRAVVVAPGDARAWRFLGHAFDGSQRPDAALSAYERALRIDPSDAVTAGRARQLREARRR